MKPAFFCCLLALTTAAVGKTAGAGHPEMAKRYALADQGRNPGSMIRDFAIAAHFTTDGSAVIYRKDEVTGQTLWRYDLASGRSTFLLPIDDLAQAVSRMLGRNVSASRLPLNDIDHDVQTGELRFIAFDRLWRRAADGTLRQTDGESLSADGLASPDGRLNIVVRGPNLFLREGRGGREIPLTADGSADLLYGQSLPGLAQKVAAKSDTVSGPMAAQWSPDGRQIVIPRLTLAGVRRLPAIDYTPRDSIYPRPYTLVYPLAGDDPEPRLDWLVVDVAKALEDGHGTLRRLDVPAQPLLQTRLPDIWWAAGRVYIPWTERGYRRFRVYAVDPASRDTRLAVDEAVTPLIAPHMTSVTSAPDLGGELLVSERSGWAQLYLVSRDDPSGGRALTTGAWEVTAVRRDASDPRSIFVTGTGRETDRSPYARQWYRVGLSGNAPLLLTPEPLDHDVTLSWDGRWMIDAMSSPTMPTRTVIRNARDGAIVTTLATADPSAFAAAGFRMPEPFTGLAADGRTPLSGMIFRPVGFDTKRRYPVIDALYTGPTTHNVPASWAQAMSAAANGLAQIGAIVVMIDGRGTSGRGQAFRLAAYRNMGRVGIDDHVAMLRQMAARFSEFDLNRVGAIGGSAGGYDAARFLLRRPDVFKVAVAASGNHELRLDKAWWPEVMMGDPDQATWAANSNVSVSSCPTGNLLLVHGELDDNVPIANSFRLAAALQASRCTGHTDFVVVPRAGHTVPWAMFWRVAQDYFATKLLRELPPSTD